MRISVYVPATSANLGPGFDCMGIALDLWNELHVERSEQTIIDIDGVGADFLPRDESNLVLQSMRLVYDRFQLPVPPIHLRMINRIPIAAGLGSSAAALVGGLLLANNLLDSPLSRAQVLRLAVLDEGHPDNVAPAFLGGAVLAYLHEDGVTHVNLPLRDNFTFIAVTPDFPLLTETARNVLEPTVTRADAVFNIAHAGFLTAALTTGNTELLRKALHDRLHQDARKHLIPGFDRVRQAAKATGAIGIVLSGAGPTLLAIVDHPPRATDIAAAMTAAFAQEGITATARILTPAQIGAYTHTKMVIKQ
ncbi:MAG: homoserine kinase [Acidibacillus sp.]|uniref:Homoserine kinase n=1 Tax=Sulfoacidibacillus ferrooxidans TaxID=2005001 RepID=A0A9X2ABJ2_9BACL|nr:Homoserine kinase [Sulfoacidibacillus ferrooxidans]MCY0893286.1 homoserine kinase [Acidibacillus sp.]